MNTKTDYLVNEDDIEQIEFVREFLIAVRREYNEYKEDTRLNNQAFSNVIWLLALRVKELEKKKPFNKWKVGKK